MNRLAAVLLVFALYGLAAVTSTAQQPDSIRGQPVVEIVLEDGTKLIGAVVAEDDATIEFLTLSGVSLTLNKEQVVSRRTLSGRMVEGSFVRDDPNATRLLFAPTARPIGAGRGYFAAYELFFPFVAFGAGSRASLAGGISLIPASPAQFLYVAPKVTVVDKNALSVAVGTVAGTFVGDLDEAGLFGVLFGLATLGESQRSVTLGAGWGFADGEVGQTPALLLGGEYQLSGSVKLISENYVFPNVESGMLLSGGVRFFGDKLAADLALLTTPDALVDGGGWPFIPWLGFAYNFQ